MGTFLSLSSQKTVLLVLFILLWLSSSSQVIYQNQVLEIKHPLFQKQFQIAGQGQGPVRLKTYLDAEGKELTIKDRQQPLFEFVLNGQKITALSSVWQYEKHSIRAMGNGGTEIVITINGVRKPVEGLQLRLYQQFFPNSTLIREKLSLHSTNNKIFTLNKLNGQLHFIFPQYSLPTNHYKSTEIRIASWAQELMDIDQGASYDDRYPVGNFNDHNLSMNHMYHPKIIERSLDTEGKISTKGPINILQREDLQWITAYEHASQDDLRGLFRQESVAEGGVIRDASQGTNGIFNFPISAADFHFLGIKQQLEADKISIAIAALRGAYLDGERIDKTHPYSSVWTATAFSRDTSVASSRQILHDYLWTHICEKSASRKAEFYYNTWGMQRRLSGQGQNLRGLLTEQKIKEEIQRAAQLGVDIFVLDDGWEQAQGDWTPHKKRLPNGLAPIKKELDKYGLKMGLWFSPMGIATTTQRYKDHPEWVILDSENNPIGAQWGHPAFDFVSGFYDLFIEDCKKLIDAGARFFKWDAINTFYSRLPNLHHGSSAYTDDEIRARYEYLLPLYVTRAMEELTNYEPELVIEVDLTEARRVMTGLAPLSQGKVFWMNNGASGYNDYSVYRAKSMRSIPNQYAGIIPLELFTYANYPHQDRKSQRYNVNTSLISGHGFWGALEEMTDEARGSVKDLVGKSKRVLPYIEQVIPKVIGRVGGSPEIYTLFNQEVGAGQVIAFSGQALNYQHRISLTNHKVLGVLNHAYQIKDDELIFDLQFPMPDATREAFIIPNHDEGISMISSTSWIDQLFLTEASLTYVNGAPGKQIIRWNKKNGEPQIKARPEVFINMEESNDDYLITIDLSAPKQEIVIKRRTN